MKKTNAFTSFITTLGRNATKCAPQIWLVVGGATLLTAVGFSISATIKSVRAVDEKKAETGKEKLTPKETAKVVWKYYIPTAAACVVGGACIVNANAISHKRSAALMTAYKLSESALREYIDKTREVVGEKKEQTIRDAIAKEKVEKQPLREEEFASVGNGDTPCLDATFGRKFKSNIDKLKLAMSNTNYYILRGDYSSLNDFYYELGLEQCEHGNLIGWNTTDGEVELVLSSQLLDDGRPCVVFGFHPAPHYDYDIL